ncbi:MAG: tRNA preQ1(34) S-adenosylmethionine ribosyltransferase-isomerase QueA [Eubacterium sp.]|nr:tRNA preQ1(34) S-adenosylmethionine ribosyltransferase-isomerase QueA [Eubacterium sp.]
MQVSDFNYELPEELIAQDPLERRSDSRLMVLNRKTHTIEHRHFRDILEYLNPGDCLVINDTKVIPARLLGVKQDTGAAVEVLLLRNHGNNVWEALVRPGKKLKPGAVVSFGDGLLTGTIEEVIEGGNRMVRFSYEGIWEELLDRLGEMPLPPYITHKLQDKNRYQTVYATHEGSAAAPTAGLHFTEELLQELQKKGIRIARLTLHVGLGTFRPVKVETIEEHHMHSEYYEFSEEAAELINRTRAEGGRVISVGTTSTRTLETVASRQFGEDAREFQPLKASSGWTDIFIYPGYTFKVVDGLITNFHLPESTLIMLVSAFYDREHVLKAYRTAVEERYRFFSFGDAMLLI